jgi:3'(2'), 5'-bisphosphate nucleotidase
MVERIRARALEAAARAAAAGGAAILALGPPGDPRRKTDGSPVTEADHASEAAVLAVLAALCPDVPVIAEEQVERDGPPDSLPPVYFAVDPIDGTREYLSGNGEYVVSIGLVEQGVATVGALCAPAKGALWSGAIGLGAWRETGGRRTAIRARRRPATGCATALISRSHPDARTLTFLDEEQGCEQLAVGSALKFAVLAEGGADLYPRFASVAVWDLAGGVALLTAAGGDVRGLDGAPLLFGPGLVAPPFIARGRT